MEERIARMEGIYEQVRDRLNGIDARLSGIDVRLTGLEHTIQARFGQVDRRFEQVDQRFMWLTGIVIGTWITTILTILFHH
jgi:tetrahydromethanopterin S-methyltransferase subunit G